jgi:hypothetical protein
MTGLGVAAFLLALFMLGLGARLCGVRLSLWKLLVVVTACVVVLGVLLTVASK